MNYFISDLHLNCQNKYEGRTLEHDKNLKENWNKTVTNGDTVYILGDIGREGGNKEMEYLCEVISTLKGKKVLIQGNHEKLKDIRVKQLFTEITPYKEISDNFNGINRNVVLCHYPILFWNGQHKNWIHLYGHLHNTNEEILYKKCMKKINEYFFNQSMKGYTDCPPARAYNVGAMMLYMNYTPRTLEEIIKNGEY